MKKAFLAILTVLYMTMSSGVAMEIHYCMGKNAGIDFYGSGDDKCGKCGMKEKKGGCCRDEHKFYKLNDSHKNVINNIDFAACGPVVVSESSFYNWQLPANRIVAAVNNNSPPDYQGPSARILNGVFRL